MPDKQGLDFDHDVVDPDATERAVPSYPVAQWHNGQPGMKSVGGVQYTGGVILPTKHLSDKIAPAGWTAGKVAFQSGGEESAWTTQEIAFAPIRTRFRWFIKKGDETIYYPRSTYASGSNMRGHVQALSAVQGIEEPVVVTFTGKGSQTFEWLLKDFDIKVMQAANRTAPRGKPLPRYAFWMTVVPGPHTKVGTGGQVSTVTQPNLVLPEDVTRDYLLSCYVGRDNLLRFQDWYRQADAWAGAWETGVGIES